MDFIGALCFLLIVSTLCGHLANRFKIPAVIGQIGAGIIIGPAVLNLIQPTSAINLFSNIGVIVLMFIGGIGSNLELLKKYLRPAIIVAVIGVIFPVIMIGIALIWFNFSMFEAIFIGVIFSATSVSISVEVLKDYHSLNTKEGATILGAAVADDIIGVVLLSIMVSLIGTIKGGQSVDFSKFGVLFIGQVIFVAVTYFMMKWIVPYLMGISEKLLMSSSPTIVCIVICLFMAWLAEKVGLSGAVGAFFGGIAVSKTAEAKLIESHVESIGYAVFVPVFFISIGLKMSFSGIGQSLGLVIVLTALACASKLLGCGLGSVVSGNSLRSSYLIGSGMISRGEMGLITAQIGFSQHIISSQYYSAVILVIILTTLIAPLLIKHSLHGLKNQDSVISDSELADGTK
ncbi:sodium:proton antiporter [Lentilactobacillus curieae]|uniref:Sodium:proton antiporter n=1 Tax=Lentilactobacillus curieae TaxID=1138822 RepID=A0A1S6QHU3_9LACO|nr:cation:proton antiporter [Lentilactobacillus curieae]AQW21175.1 sodium:proton antiporter [Lentilactobacillus curieae]